MSVLAANTPLTTNTSVAYYAEEVSNKGVLATSEVPQIASTTPPTATGVKAAVIEEFGETHIMVKVAECESGFRQFDSSGAVLKNPTSSAKGVFQIMESLHHEYALSLGLDTHTLEGNIAYARLLYAQSGTVPWDASKKCWGKYLV